MLSRKKFLLTINSTMALSLLSKDFATSQGSSMLSFARTKHCFTLFRNQEVGLTFKNQHLGKIRVESNSGLRILVCSGFVVRFLEASESKLEFCSPFTLWNLQFVTDMVLGYSFLSSLMSSSH